MNPQQIFQAAIQAHQAGKLTEAQTLYQQVLVLDPNSAEVLHPLGLVKSRLGQLDEGIALLRRAVALQPQVVEHQAALAAVLADAGRPEEAWVTLRKAMVLAPSMTADPGMADLYFGLGNIFAKELKYELAAECFAWTVLARPDFAEAHNNLGRALRELSQFDEAVDAYHRCIAIKPLFPAAHYNLGEAMETLGRIPEAIDAYKNALIARPDLAWAHVSLATMMLLSGDLKGAWPDWEWRLKCEGLPPARPFTQPQWSGQPLANKTILIHAEQGLGNTIQFIRYTPLLAGRGARIVLECPQPLHRLLRSMKDLHQIISPGDSLPPFDFHCPMLSLPGAFGTEINTIPAVSPYLTAPPDLAAAWKQKLQSQDKGLRVGLVWAGDPSHALDHRRSLRLAQFRPLVDVAGVHFYNLQKGPAGLQAAAPPDGLKLIDYSSELTDFAETAGLISQLDLIITVDTAVAHLAGAMGKPVWILLPYVPDWRWLLSRADSPWYPTARLFRTEKLGDWKGPIKAAAAGLDELRSNWASLV